MGRQRTNKRLAHGQRTVPEPGPHQAQPRLPAQSRRRHVSISGALIGRSFVHPLFDYLLIGGGLSLVATVVAVLYPQHTELLGLTTLAYLVLLSNSAHFAASTVRLYTKPGTYRSLPFLTMLFPLVSLLVLAACMGLAGGVGPHVQALYLTWSPYHYAAQAYGLAVMYAYRSGCQLVPADKKLLWWASMLPFLHAFTSGVGIGLDWLVPASVLTLPPVDATLRFVAHVLPYAGIGVVPLLFGKIWRSPSGPLPVISVLMLVTNAVWWFVLDPIGAFTWATIFHGLQYLAIATIFHVKDQMAQPGNRHGTLHHVLRFYGASLLLGYGLFNCLPWAFASAGFGLLESIALVVAAINVHHFIVDAYIWRTKAGDGNRQIIEAGQPAAV